METTGVLIADPTFVVINTRNGEMNKWSFVLSIPGQVIRKVAFEAMGDKGDILADCVAGQELTVKANVESREYNGKWYTNCTAWSIKAVASGASTGGTAPKPAPVAPAPAKPEPIEEEADLPF